MKRHSRVRQSIGVSAVLLAALFLLPLAVIVPFRTELFSSEKTAQVAKEFFKQAVELLKGQPKANCLTMRGFATKPNLPSYEELYGLKAAAIAVYPMYKGLASLVGMELVGKPATLQEEESGRAESK